MKTKLFLLILIVATLQNYAQDFAPIGAIWHYSQGTPNPNMATFKTIESISDTTINGKLCHKLIEVERIFDAVSVVYHFMYSENDSVFIFGGTDFHLLYDFGANTGDTILLGFKTHDGSPLKMIIDSTGEISVGNELRKIQYITCGDGIVIEFGKHVIRNIGNTSFMFPTLDGSMNGPLRCYEDSLTGLFINPFHPDWWDHQDCEEIITGIRETENTEKTTVFPNPTTSSISIKNIDRETEYKIFNVSGEIVLNGIISELNEIKMTELQTGIYFIELKNDNMLTVKKIIKK